MTPKTRQKISKSLRFSQTKSGMSPRSTPRKRLQPEQGTFFSKYKKSKIPSNEQLSDEYPTETERLSTNVEQVQAIQNESFEATPVDTDKGTNHSDSLNEMESENTKTEIDTRN